MIGIVIGEVVIATGAKRSAKRDTTSKSGSVKIEGAGSGANARKELTGNSVSAKKNADTKTGLNDREPRSVERGFFVPDLVFMPLVSTRLACFSLNTSSRIGGNVAASFSRRKRSTTGAPTPVASIARVGRLSSAVGKSGARFRIADTSLTMVG